MNIIDNCIQFVRKTLRSRYCHLCDNDIQDLEIDLCSDCIADLPYKNQPCSRCGIELDSHLSPVCGQCLSLPPNYDVLVSPFEYQFPIDKFITELKFNHKLYSSQTLGHLFSRYIQAKTTPLPECIIPVPLHPKRIQQRGYNQSLEIARVVSKNLGIPIDKKIVARIKDTKPQSNLDAKNRQKNIRNAFSIRQANQYQHVAIFDDVVTTGHTVEAVSKLLRQQNIKVIQVWSIARVTSTH